MKSPAKIPLRAILRLLAGTVAGTFGLGLIGTNLFPVRPLGLVAGLVLLTAGLIATLGLVTARNPG